MFLRLGVALSLTGVGVQRSTAPNLPLTLLGLGLAGLLAACATPHYETVTRLELPTDAAGRACAAQCAERLSDCQADCGRNYAACVAALEPRVEESYAEALQRYAQALDRYAADLRHLQFDLWFNWRHRLRWYDPWWHAPWYDPWWLPGPPPRRPTRQEIEAELRQRSCVEDCGCLLQNEACILACGGRRVSEQRCVRNCPPLRP
ncbi:MAG: hypothetical protein NZ524_07805 [Thiobacillaceae bacterium]|nr:hypothetical protein [Thiobacillaceae bacterium]